MRHTDSVVYPPTGSKPNVREMSTPPTLHWSMAPLYCFFTNLLTLFDCIICGLPLLTR